MILCTRIHSKHKSEIQINNITLATIRNLSYGAELGLQVCAPKFPLQVKHLMSWIALKSGREIWKHKESKSINLMDCMGVAFAFLVIGWVCWFFTVLLMGCWVTLLLLFGFFYIGPVCLFFFKKNNTAMNGLWIFWNYTKTIFMTSIKVIMNEGRYKKGTN